MEEKNPSGAGEFEDEEETTREHLQCKPCWTSEPNLSVVRKETRRETFLPMIRDTVRLPVICSQHTAPGYLSAMLLVTQGSSIHPGHISKQ